MNKFAFGWLTQLIMFVHCLSFALRPAFPLQRRLTARSISRESQDEDLIISI